MNRPATFSGSGRCRRWFLTPTALFMAVIAGEVLLLLADRFDWLPFNARKGWSVIICVVAVAVLTFILAVYSSVSVVRRRRTQFSVSALLTFVVTLAIPCGWMAGALRAAQQQRDRVAACREAGCWPFYDYALSAPGQPQYRSGSTSSPWLYERLGEDFFHNVTGVAPRTDDQLLALRGQTSIHTVIANNSQLTNAGLECIRSFPRLRWLDLRDAPQVTDDGMKHLRGLAELECLMLRRTLVSNTGIACLRDKEHLQALDLGMTKVTGRGLKHLRKSTQLRSLQFWANDIDDEALIAIRDMTQLEDLDLGFASITDAGLKHLKDMSRLRSLGLRGSQVTDEGMRQIARFRALQRLDLYKVAISDASVKHLGQLQRLETLYIGETHLTQTGIANLGDALPNCEIKHN